MKLLVGGLLVLIVASGARAGVLTGSISLSPTAGSGNDYSYLGWYVPSGGWSVPGVDATSVDITDTVSENAGPDGMTFAGMLSSDPHVELLEHITNTSGAAWTGFKVEVDPDANSTLSNLVGLFPPGGVTTNFTTASASGNVLTFGGGTVAAGQTVLLDVAFDISLINNSFPGNFSYNIVNTAVPEPATLGVFGVAGVVGLLKRRRGK